MTADVTMSAVLGADSKFIHNADGTISITPNNWGARASPPLKP